MPSKPVGISDDSSLNVDGLQDRARIDQRGEVAIFGQQGEGLRRFVPKDPLQSGLAVYADSYYAGEPALIRNRFGKGEAYYFGGAFSLEAAKAFLRRLGAAQPYAELIDVPEGCEIAVRRKPVTENGAAGGAAAAGETAGEGAAWLFVLNYQHEPVQITLKRPMQELTCGKPEEGTVTLEKFGVRVYRIS